MGDQIYMLSEAVDKWRETARRAIQGRDENYRAYQQELRTNRALQARLDEALLNWTEERGLRDGWEQTAGELQAQVRQSDGNTQRVEAERDEALQAMEHARNASMDFLKERDAAVALANRAVATGERAHADWLTEEQRNDTLRQQLEVKEATIERLEAALKAAQRNDQRDSWGWFRSVRP